ncbi:hypothetical protein K491DRAFT_690099 [Lophiostoma macrostomum CBS 122681]|uniref:Uncharacterized protein n=1 Tax=Lophiostoma macrostomum CBS 122681 TaxID=1314788 RepID=A0A6A6TI27_9PLEO|nr:hypothetical protein K491DRAFT_690099 [Lophiostoma macrostomum CBS 122681]
MPPRMPVRVPWTSPACIATPNSSMAVRAFTSTAPSLALGPESPNYIEVPKPLQPTFDRKPRVKGILPTPRDVFKTRSTIPKQSNQFIQRTTPDPKVKKLPGKYSQDADYRLYKQRLSDSRREAFREGVKELHQRTKATQRQEKAALNQLFADRREAAMAPRREVDILTETTISKGVRDFLADKLPSTSRSKISAAARLRFQRKMAKHAAVRESRLHDLYTNAREFIVSEDLLDEAIEKAFGTDEEPVTWDYKGNEVSGVSHEREARSPWNGPIPEGVGDKLQSLKGGEGVGLAKQRIKKVAEELTGGKM